MCTQLHSNAHDKATSVERNGYHNIFAKEFGCILCVHFFCWNWALEVVVVCCDECYTFNSNKPSRSWICFYIRKWKVASIQDADADLDRNATHSTLFSILTFEFPLKWSVIFWSHELQLVISQTCPVHLWWLIFWSLKPQPVISQTPSGSCVTGIFSLSLKPQLVISQTHSDHLYLVIFSEVSNLKWLFLKLIWFLFNWLIVEKSNRSKVIIFFVLLYVTLPTHLSHMQGFQNSNIKFHSCLIIPSVSGWLPYICIYIADDEVQMRMQGEWACSYPQCESSPLCPPFLKHLLAALFQLQRGA